MKLDIYNNPEIIKLKRNQKLLPDKIYLIGSESVTNSLYFRNVDDIKTAHKLIIQRLSGILSVIDYLFTPKGWLLLVKFKTKSEVLGFYRRMRGLKNDESIIYDIGRVISEIIRTTISTLASYINKGSKRKGALVSRAFKRFSISSISTVKVLIGKMKKREIILSNQNKQFTPSIKSWKNNILPKIGMCFLSSNKVQERIKYRNQLFTLINIVEIKFEKSEIITNHDKDKPLIINENLLV